jgi:hypothetical protein
LSYSEKGAHEWIIEFKSPPADIERFAISLDKNLQTINSDYEAKRFLNLAITQLILHSVNKGTFHRWMRSKMKFGNQNKVPRLSENRAVFEEILSFSK